MTVLSSFFVHVLVTALVHQSKAVQDIDMDRALTTYHRSFDNCRDVTDSTHEESKAAADRACEQAFEALDNMLLNGCKGCAHAGCRLISGQKDRQCTCKIASRNDNLNKNDIVKTFRECAAGFLFRESRGILPGPSADYIKIRKKYDDALQVAEARREYQQYMRDGDSGSSSAAFAFTAGEAGSSRGAFTQAEASSSSRTQTTRGTAPRPCRPRSRRVFFSNNFTCSVCGKPYDRYKNMREHEKSHTTLDTHCFECKTTFETKQGYKTHLRNKHPEDALETKDAEKKVFTEDNPQECDVCHKRFRTAANLQKHKTYHDEKTTCNDCYRVFRSPSELLSHRMSTHLKNGI